MKKIGVLVLLICIFCGSFSSAFAVDFQEDIKQNVPRSAQQVKLFEIPMDTDCMRPFRDIEYHAEEKALYVLMPTCDSHYRNRENQLVYDLVGNEIIAPQYPITSDALVRTYIEFDSENVYSSNYEYDSDSSTTKMYNLGESEELGTLEFDIYNGGFKVSGNRVAYRLACSGDDESPKFYIGSLNPFTTSEGAVSIYSETTRIKAFDFNPSGSELIYGTYVNPSEGENFGIAIRTVSATTGEKIDEFLIGDTGFEDEGEKGWRPSLALSLYTTKDHIVVLSHMGMLDKGKIQRFTYEGVLVDEVETNYQVRGLTEGPNGSTIYIEKRFNEDADDSCEGSFEVVQVNWKEKSASRPRSMIGERSFGGQTVATFRDHGFGLLRAEDPETGELNYQAPLKSDESSVKLRVPFSDMNAKVSSGAESLRISYQGQLIQIPMSAFDCADLLATMPCQDDATIEIQLEMDDDGNVRVGIQLFVVEQVNEMTRVVHRINLQ